MKTGIRHPLSLILLAAAFVCSPQSAMAAKPVMLVTLSNLDQLFGDFGYLASAVGMGQPGQAGTMLASQYTVGVDATKPIGIIITEEEGNPKPLVMLPMKDLDDFLGGLKEQLGEPRDAGNGVLELAGPAPFYLKEHNGWVFVTQSSDDLASIPSDPMKIIGSAASKYDISVRLYVQNIPEQYRKMAIEQMREAIEMQVDNLPPSEDMEAQKRVFANNIQTWEAMINETDQLTLGIGIDAKTRKFIIDFNLTAASGTQLAKKMDLLGNLKSRFSGFLMSDAAITAHMMSKILPEDISKSIDTMNAIVPPMMREIANSDDLDETQKATITRIVDALVTSVRETIQTGETDMGISLLTNDGLTLVGGTGVADGAKLESAIQQALAFATEEAAKNNQSDKIDVRLGVDQHAGVRMHRVTIKTPDDEDTQKALGDELVITIGIADKSAYIAAGKNGEAMLRKAIDASAQSANNKVLPLRIRISVARILHYAQDIADDPTLKSIVNELDRLGEEQGYIMIVSKPIPNGVQGRLEIREGVFKAIGTGFRAATPEPVESGF